MVYLSQLLLLVTVPGGASHGHHARGAMKLFKDSGPPATHTSVLADDCYTQTYPNAKSCVKWWINGSHRYVEGNSIPDHNEHGVLNENIGPYCPFGNTGGGYCLPEENASACPFAGMVCPDQASAKKLNLSGDVPVPFQVWYEFPLNPDPTAEDLPNHLYYNSAMYQQVGVHLNGVHVKGPSEAEGYNVDQANIPLLCGGHVTPPIGPGPVYHYHKPAPCGLLMESSGAHSPLVAYANDGYAIYGSQDLDGTAPVVDECNGHFGPIVPGGAVTYHYHVHNGWTRPDLTFEKQEPSFQPFWIGCQGPSKSLCNTTIAKAKKGEEDLNHVWCGTGCGFDLCVQPGTTEETLKTYLGQFSAGAAWLGDYSINDYTNYPGARPSVGKSSGDVIV